MMTVPEFRNGNIRLIDDERLAEEYDSVNKAVGVGAEAREFERVAAREIDRRDIWGLVY